MIPRLPSEMPGPKIPTIEFTRATSEHHSSSRGSSRGSRNNPAVHKGEPAQDKKHFNPYHRGDRKQVSHHTGAPTLGPPGGSKKGEDAFGDGILSKQLDDHMIKHIRAQDDQHPSHSGQTTRVPHAARHLSSPYKTPSPKVKSFREGSLSPIDWDSMFDDSKPSERQQ